MGEFISRGRRLIGFIEDKLFDSFFEFSSNEDSVNENAWSVDIIGIEFAIFNDFFDFSDSNLATEDRIFVEVSCSLVVVQVALFVCFLSFNNRKISRQYFLHDVGSSIEDSSLLKKKQFKFKNFFQKRYILTYLPL